MPAPHRRNKGDSLAHQIESRSGARTVADQRDNLVAQRTRANKKWEAAASSLEQRAAQVRTEHERAKALDRFSTAVRQGRAKPPVVVLAPKRQLRFWLGCCIDCDRSLWVHTVRPRVPICRACSTRREAKKHPKKAPR